MTLARRINHSFALNMCNKSASRTYPLCIAASNAVNPSPSFAAMSKRFAVTKNFASASLSDITAQCLSLIHI